MIDETELVLFDCDGVLVDSEPIALAANVALGRRFGWPLTEQEAISLFLGRSAAAIDAEIAQRCGEEASVQWRAEFETRLRTEFDAYLQPVPGIVEALNAIEPHVAVCVASSGSHAKMRHTLGHTGLYDRFKGRIFSAEEVTHGKPAPDLFLHAAASMGVAPARCVVVEDSHHGVLAARAAGMRSLGYAGGLTPAAWLEGPDTLVFEDMLTLPALLGV
ncbi:HAD family hydrolase [Actinospica durhamensis]|uniref:HAD family hydrolase n=1 Tax=Actinospica durhamensis TaxID=1508375 RepID=A0A941EYC1_9ACTN|nr:HAD family hydrolase [Actinospica durhamensis]MBR7839331.1 HAD family hydrolase [Actinospica durhamensis]